MGVTKERVKELEEQRSGNCFNVRRGGMDERNDDRTDK
jgi:hypothetical protein